MSKEDLIKDFRISIKIEQFLGFNQLPQRILTYETYARGIDKLRRAFAKCFNEAEEFIRKDLQKEKKGTIKFIKDFGV